MTGNIKKIIIHFYLLDYISGKYILYNTYMHIELQYTKRTECPLDFNQCTFPVIYNSQKILCASYIQQKVTIYYKTKYIFVYQLQLPR